MLEDARAEIARLEQRLLQEMGATRALNERAQTLTATAAAADKRAEGLQSELDAARARLQANVDLASENSRVSRSLTEKDAALDDARTRIKFLEAALTAAEAECTRLAAEMSGARDKHGADSDALNGLLETMSSRAITADKLLAEARQRLHARTAENGAAEKRLADARAAYNEIDGKNRQLLDELRLRQFQVDELESRLTLVNATNALLETFQDRDRALACAEDKIKSLSERNAQLEAQTDLTDSPGENDAPKILMRTLDSADERTREDWAELARHLTALVKLKRQSSDSAKVQSMTLLAGTVTF
jgi:crescentin